MELDPIVPDGYAPAKMPIDKPLTLGEKCTVTLISFLFVSALFYCARWGLEFLADKYGWSL